MLGTTLSFETESPNFSKVALRIEVNIETCGYFVVEEVGVILGCA